MRRFLAALGLLLLPLGISAAPNPAYNPRYVAQVASTSYLPTLLVVPSAVLGGGGGSTFTGGDIDDPLGLPDGSAAAPAIYFTSDTDLGFYKAGTGIIAFVPAGSANDRTQFRAGRLEMYSGGALSVQLFPSLNYITMASDHQYVWDSANPIGGTPDTGLERVGPGIVGITDGSTGQGNLTANSYQTQHSKALTDATATAFVRVAVADDDYEGVNIHYTVYAEDADTDARQVVQGMVSVAILNNSGTESCAVPTNYNNYVQATNVPAGTLTVAFDCNSAVADTVDIRANADTSLDAAAETLKIEYTVVVTSGTATVTAQ